MLRVLTYKVKIGADSKRGKVMKLNIIKKAVATASFGLIALLGTGEIANAQNNRQVQKQQQKIAKQQQKVEKQQDKIDNQRAKLEAQRIRAEQERLQLAQQRQRAEQLRLQQQRQEQIRLQNQRNRNAVVNNNNRYRVYRNGGYYQTDNRGAELLRQAVNNGYQQGVRAGQTDRANRRGSSYNNSVIYRSGNYGYQSYVDQSQYQYYFRQGFERGYQDGYNSRSQYGTNSGGAFNILGAILQQVLNIQAY